MNREIPYNSQNLIAEVTQLVKFAFSLINFHGKILKVREKTHPRPV
jgi:hypothetical protein